MFDVELKTKTIPYLYFLLQVDALYKTGRKAHDVETKFPSKVFVKVPLRIIYSDEYDFPITESVNGKLIKYTDLMAAEVVNLVESIEPIKPNKVEIKILKVSGDKDAEFEGVAEWVPFLK